MGCRGYFLDLFFVVWVRSKKINDTHEFSVSLFPLWEGRFAIASTVRAIYRDISGKGRTTIMTGEGLDTPPDAKGGEKISTY